MTDEEREMLAEIHEALFTVPVGSPDDERPLIHDIRTIVRAYSRARWSTRMIVWLLPTIAALGVAVKTIVTWWSTR